MSTPEETWLPAPILNGKPEAPPPGEAGDWKARLIRTKYGPAAVLANAIIGFRSPEMRSVVAFDLFSLSAVIRAKAPWGSENCTVTDHEERLAADWLQHHGVLVSPEVAGQALQVIAREHPVHPVREYHGGLRWDGTKRLEGWLSLYLGVEPSDYSAAVGLKFMVGAVARIDRPGVKNDCCLILEGEQGIKKSTALRVLGQPWFTDELADLGSKDAALQTRGVWLIEIAELDSLTRGEVSRIKAFMSRTVDRFRPPYGRHLLESPRQCVFAGSVNHNVYLRDETGGRRFWPVACTRILIDELARDRDQLWAEAIVRYKTGAAWWLETTTLNVLAEEEQSARYEGSAWDGLILRWAYLQIEGGVGSVSTAEVLDRCIEKPCGQWTRADEMKVGACLRNAKWIRFKDRRQGWRYRPPVPTSGGNGLLGGNAVSD